MEKTDEFVFIRPLAKESKLVQDNVSKYESFLRSQSEDVSGIDESIFWHSINDASKRLGTQAVSALLGWGVVSIQVKTGEPVSADALQKAIFDTATIAADITTAKISTPETRLTALLLTCADFVGLRAKELWARTLASSCADHVRIIAEAKSGNVVYWDSFLLVSWRSGLGAWEPELFVCTFNSELNIYTYLPQSITCGTNVTPPLSSFKAARAAIQNWRGRQLSGDLVGSTAIRLCSILGIEVQGDKGFIKGNQKRPNGF